MAQGNFTVAPTESTITGNSATGYGGGLYIHASGLMGVSIENSSVLDNNGTSWGGGIYVNGGGNVIVQNSNVSGNTAGTGGGIGARGGSYLLVDSCTVSNNHATSYAGGLVAQHASLSVVATSIANNSALYGAGGVAGWGDTTGTFSMANTTVVGNTASQLGGGVLLYSPLGLSTITNCTITGNSGGKGGGAFLYGRSPNVLIRNSIIAENVSTVGSPNQISGKAATNVSVLFSLIGDANDVLANPNVNIVANTNNLLAMNPNLGALGSHGGPTATMLPPPTSPVVNAGDPNQAGLSAYDQRGLTRVVEGRVDIGAVELQTCSNSTNLEGEGGCPVGGTTGGTTTGGTATGGTTTGGSHGGGGGGSGCAVSPAANNPFGLGALLAAAAGLLVRRRRRD